MYRVRYTTPEQYFRHYAQKGQADLLRKVFPQVDMSLAQLSSLLNDLVSYNKYDKDVYEFLLSQGIDVNQKFDDHFDSLKTYHGSAIVLDNKSMLSHLIRFGAKLNEKEINTVIKELIKSTYFDREEYELAMIILDTQNLNEDQKRKMLEAVKDINQYADEQNRMKQYRQEVVTRLESELTPKKKEKKKNILKALFQ